MKYFHQKKQQQVAFRECVQSVGENETKVNRREATVLQTMEGKLSLSQLPAREKHFGLLKIAA